MLHISILTLFPEMFDSVFSQSIVRRAIRKNTLQIDYIQLRDFSTDKYKSVDDHPYGGGHGMIVRVDIIDRALQFCKKTYPHLTARTVLLDPKGSRYTQARAVQLSRYNHIILICGHYEGTDERVRSLVDEEISVGDYILTGGEIPAMAVVDSVVRLLPDTFKNTSTTRDESFSSNLLEYPQYTRPELYKGKRVPKVLMSGHHENILRWKRDQSLRKTKKLRPDLLKK